MKTKIIATIGPATNTREGIVNLVKAGARIFRLNFSHGGADKFTDLIKVIRDVEDETGNVLTVMQDLSGPKVRTCDLGHGTLEIAKGEELFLTSPGGEEGVEGKVICVNLPDTLSGLKEGDPVALSDGMLRFNVTERVGDQLVKIKSVNAGLAPPRKGISFPGKRLNLEALTAKDREDLRAGIDLGVDIVAMSYVQNADDICRLKSLMKEYGRRLPVIAKLETANAVENLQRILEESDGIMVARGDLGLECDLAMLPALQKRIIRACNDAGKPVIVATQMLLSMVTSPMATRAETTDVANAILDGADCVMLSEETAIGKYPAETVRFMCEVGDQAEGFRFEDDDFHHVTPTDQDRPAKFLAYAACLLADKTRAKAIVCHSRSGSTARTLSACRPRRNVYALSPDDQVRHFTNLSWGVVPVAPDESAGGHQERAEAFVLESPLFSGGDVAIIAAGQPKKGQIHSQTNFVKIFEK